MWMPLSKLPMITYILRLNKYIYFITSFLKNLNVYFITYVKITYLSDNVLLLKLEYLNEVFYDLLAFGEHLEFFHF